MTRKDKYGRVLYKNESVRKSDGRYVFDVMRDGKRFRLTSSTLQGLREKEKEYNMFLANHYEPSQAYRIRFCDMCDRYMELRNINQHNKQKQIYRIIQNHIVPSKFYKMLMKDIKYSHVLNLYQSLKQEKKLKHSTIQKINSIVSRIFQLAVNDDVIAKNPCPMAMKSVPVTNEERYVPYKAYSQEQQNKFLSIVHNIHYYTLFVVLFGTGMRIGEARAIEWEDVDFEQNLIYVRKNIVGNSLKELEVHKGKTSASIRVIPLLPEVKDALIKYYNSIRVPLEGKKLPGCTNPIFVSSWGNYISPSHVNKKIKDYVALYNNTHEEQLPHLYPHMMRHSFCTRLCEQNVNPKIIQSIMGHTNIDITLNVYTEVSQKMQQDSFNQIRQSVSIF